MIGHALDYWPYLEIVSAQQANDFLLNYLGSPNRPLHSKIISANKQN